MTVAIAIPELPPLARQLEEYKHAKPLFRFGYRPDGSIRLASGHPPPNKGQGVRGGLIRLLRGGPMTRAQLIAALPKASIKTIESSLTKAISEGKVERKGRAQYRLTAAFRTELS